LNVVEHGSTSKRIATTQALQACDGGAPVAPLVAAKDAEMSVDRPMQLSAVMASTPFSIVVGVKLDDADDLALREALELAARTPGSLVHAVAVVEPIGDVIPRTQEGRDAAIAQAIAKLRKRVSAAIDEMTIRDDRPPPIARVQVHGEYGHPAHALAFLAVLVEADLIVVGMRKKRGVKDFIVGTIAESLIKSAECAVYVARPKTTGEGPHAEPVCPECEKRRKETAGTALWCARHSEHHPRAHAYGYQGANFDTANAWGFSEPPAPPEP
jgi:nucleotide-binding universal stress UspA family protein